MINKKIFMYIYSLHIGGGAENVFFKTALHLKKCGYELIVCGMLDEYPSFEEQFAKNKIRVVRLSCRSHNVLHILSRLIPVLKNEKPDVLFSWLFPCIITGGIAAKFAGVKHVVSNLRGPDLKKKKKKVRLDHWISRLYTGHIAVSQSVADIFIQREKYNAKKLTVIENGISQSGIVRLTQKAIKAEKAKLKIAPDDFVVGTVGRLYIEKNQQLLINALPVINKYIPYVKLLLVGDGPYRSALENLVFELGLRDQVVFAGWQKDTFKYLQLMDIYALPSWYEGHPGSILQAWLMQLPVVATKVTGTRDLVVDGKNGLLVSKDDPEELAKVIVNLRNNPDYMNRIALDGYDTVKEKYTEQNMLDNYEKYFEKLIFH